MIDADLIADIGEERRVVRDHGVHSGIQFEPGAADVRLERDRTVGR
jgi:hypothetical protein